MRYIYGVMYVSLIFSVNFQVTWVPTSIQSPLKIFALGPEILDVKSYSRDLAAF